MHDHRIAVHAEATCGKIAPLSRHFKIFHLLSSVCVPTLPALPSS